METKCEYCAQPIELIVNSGKWEHVDFNEDCWTALPSSKPDVPKLDIDDSYLSDMMKLAFGE